MSSNKEIYWISNLRILATFAVVLLHCASPLVVDFEGNSRTNWWASNTYDGLARFCVPVFVMISGYLLLGKPIDFFNFYIKRLKRIVLPFVFWTLIYLICNVFVFKTILYSSFFSLVVKFFMSVVYGSVFHFWFIYMIIGLYLIIPFINPWIVKARKIEIEFFIIVWLVSILFDNTFLVTYKPNLNLSFFSNYLGYLILGYYLGNYNLKFFRYSMLKILVYLFSGTIILLGTYYLTSIKNKFDGYFYGNFNFMVILNTVSLFLVFKDIVNVRLTKYGFFKLLNENSFGIYLIHILILKCINLLGISINLFNSFLSIPLLAILTLVLSNFAIRMLKFVPFGKNIIG